VKRWRCPSCAREFDRLRQSHVCAPGVGLDDVLAGRPAWQRQAYEALVDPLRRRGDLHEDAVSVGVFLKRQRKLAEVRPMATMLKVYAMLPAGMPSPAVVRRERAGDRVLHVVNLRSVADVDAALADLLLEAWEDAGS
jgi:hypothetical protein